ncbi:methyl-accepting chemotaxis protein [Amphibacillus sp. MSJ-3]|uniref:methyl-accepting chemotaxis protein n=1 Tax=Amphibacillus sp. MSJ-3 TaxID=2841505 RepID=UPI001C0F3628|nr:methyl-accepting chemotaxis protein [Amphibacillus sp. MSJ-3]MBU5595491.1 methyl-accepting chemotaxis protein [Amphibacillus sp. MSJ-3]
MKTNTDRKLIHRLYLMIGTIIMTCIIAAGFIYYFSSDVTNQSEVLEETASLQQEFSEMVNYLNKTSIVYYQLATSGYDQSLTEDAEYYLTEAREQFTSLTDRIEDGDELEHYFQHLDGAITAYQTIYEENFTNVFLGDEVEKVSSRVIPVITRNEDTIHTVNERIQDMLADRRDEASDSLQVSLLRSDTMIMIALISLIVVPFISLLLFAKRLNSGVNLVMRRIKAYHDGDLAYNQSTKRKDEFSKIDERLANMGEQLRTILERNKQISEDVLNVVQSTSQKSSEQLKGMSEIDQMMIEFSKEMERQTDFTGTISATTEEVSSSTEEIQSSISKVSTQLEELETVSNQGLDLMNQLEHTMKAFNDQTSGTAGRVDKMQDQLEHITSFIQGIDDIADQTNLLAINASIEAAKAGKEGRSFAVVADEIRKLSQGTNEFSNRIKNVLEELRNEANQVVTSFSDFKTDSLQSLDKAVESAILFKQISNDNTKVTQGHHDIDESIMEINQAIANVVESITELVNGATVLQEKSKSVAQIVEEQTKRQEELTNEINSLVEVSQLLKD